MAISDYPVFVSRILATTVASSDLFKVVSLSTDGHVQVKGTSTAKPKPFGIYYGGGGLSSSTDVGAATIGIGGILKVRMAASTQVAGRLIGMSSAHLGCTPTTDHFIIGKLMETLTTTGIGSVQFWPVAQHYAANLEST